VAPAGATAACTISTSIRYEHEHVTVLEHRVLLDPLVVEHGAGGAAEVDHPHVGPGHLDHRVHARDGVVLQAEMAALELADLDDVLSDRLRLEELVVLVDLEVERLGHAGASCDEGRGPRQRGVLEVPAAVPDGKKNVS
jgi:hypothetical protein